MRPFFKSAGRIVSWSTFGFLLLAGVALWANRNTVMDDAQQWIRDYQAEALKKALLTEVSQLPLVDEVEVYRLDSEPAFPGQKPFHKSVERAALMYEAKKAVLKGADAEALTALWRSEVVAGNAVNCHEPHHALRFLRQGSQVSQAVICFHCENAEIPCSILGGELIEFDKLTPQYAALKKRLEELVGAAP